MKTSRCWAEINLAALRHNAAVARKRVGSGVDLLAVVKANAYGHGMVEVARALSDVAESFGVANVAEAQELRGSGISHPIVILGPALPDERFEIAQHGFIASVSSFDETAEFDRVAREQPIAVNFVIDSGMGRMGTWEDEALDELEKMRRLPNVRIHSLSTHLPVADEDANFTETELRRFTELVARIRARVSGDYAVHVLLSAGVLAFAKHPFDVIRPGLMLYGISPLPEFQQLLRPVMTLKSKVALMRQLPAGRAISYGRTFTTRQPTRVATLSAGYADGYPRSLSSNGAAVLIRGRRCAVLGRITMDLIMVDVSAVEQVRAGDEVVLFGRQGGEEILASEIAQRAGTIPWEIFTGIGSRVRRVYV